MPPRAAELLPSATFNRVCTKTEFNQGRGDVMWTRLCEIESSILPSAAHREELERTINTLAPYRGEAIHSFANRYLETVELLYLNHMRTPDSCADSADYLWKYACSLSDNTLKLLLFPIGVSIQNGHHTDWWEEQGVITTATMLEAFIKDYNANRDEWKIPSLADTKPKPFGNDDGGSARKKGGKGKVAPQMPPQLLLYPLLSWHFS